MSSIPLQINICPNCEKKIVHVESRKAETPKEVIGFSHVRHYTIIGRAFVHDDGTICDETLYVLKKLPKPKFLRLGEKGDPRN